MDNGDRILMDSNAIIEAHRLNCWNNLLSFFSIETVDMCARECASGKQLHQNYVPVDTNALRKDSTVHHVNDAMRRELIFKEPSAADIDDGELDLLAFALILPPEVFLICSPDKACMKVASKLGLLERLVSLESLAGRVGQGNLSFKLNYTEKWHRQKCSEILLDIL